MRLKVKKGNEKIDLGEIVYTSEKINDNNIESSLYDVYGRPSVYKENAWHNIERDCKAVHGYGLHIISYKVSFFSTAFNVRLDGTLYKIVDTPSRRIAYTNDKRLNFNGISVRVYGCRDKWIRDNIRALVKPYLKAIGVKKGKVESLGFDNDYKFILNGFDTNETKLENFNAEYYKTNINL